MADIKINDRVLNRVWSFLRYVQSSQKGSIGSIDNAYLPQIDRGDLDSLMRDLKIDIESRLDE